MFVHLPTTGTILNLGHVSEIRSVVSEDSADISIALTLAGAPEPRVLGGPDAAAVLEVLDPLGNFRRRTAAGPGPSLPSPETP